MNGVYKSLKGKVQDTFQMSKPSSTPVIHENSAGDLNLNDEMEKLETMVAESVGKLKAGVKQREAKIAGEARQAEQAMAGLKTNIATLEAKLKEAEDTARKKDSSRQQIEETLKAKVQELQNDLKKKEDALAARAKELADLQAGMEAKGKQIGELQSAGEKARQEAAAHGKRADDLAVVSRTKIETLEAQIKEREELARQKDANIKELEQKLAGKIQDFEALAKNRQELLAGRDAVISDLKSQLKLLTKGIGEMSSFFKQAQAFAVLDRQEANPANPKAPVSVREEKFDAQNNPAKSPFREEKTDVQAYPTKSAASVQERTSLSQSGSANVMPLASEQRPAVTQINAAKVAAAEEKPAAAQSNAVKVIPPNEKPLSTPPNGTRVAPGAQAARGEIFPADVFERMSKELAEVAGLMSPLAMLIVREHVEGLGESLENFPKSRLPELLDSLVKEILDEKRQLDFRKRLARYQLPAANG